MRTPYKRPALAVRTFVTAAARGKDTRVQYEAAAAAVAATQGRGRTGGFACVMAGGPAEDEPVGTGVFAVIKLRNDRRVPCASHKSLLSRTSPRQTPSNNRISAAERG